MLPSNLNPTHKHFATDYLLFVQKQMTRCRALKQTPRSAKKKVSSAQREFFARWFNSMVELIRCDRMSSFKFIQSIFESCAKRNSIFFKKNGRESTWKRLCKHEIKFRTQNNCVCLEGKMLFPKTSADTNNWVKMVKRLPLKGCSERTVINTLWIECLLQPNTEYLY